MALLNRNVENMLPGVQKRYVGNILQRERKSYLTKYDGGTKPLCGKSVTGGKKTLCGKYVTGVGKRYVEYILPRVQKCYVTKYDGST